jgi:DNA-binding PadR family transcriptional regulator
MLKSQLNHVLNKMQEEHYLISYAKDDKRKIYYRINQDGLANYELEHQKIIKILSKSISQMGEEKTKQLVDLLNQYVDLFSKIMKEE